MNYDASSIEVSELFKAYEDAMNYPVYQVMNDAVIQYLNYTQQLKEYLLSVLTDHTGKPFRYKSLEEFVNLSETYFLVFDTSYNGN